ncbi:hypothetical protein PAALTS15_13557 [Paenibacillus alvei TS-15]|uniref:Uncharacterized protein n=1 Tax=Paenibacillus alvei TS-15 TaxID=1117108 RepID=S9SPM2_PAEAL|nr:hypothetical protein [Paenibacillus alvei]EPY06634.1 hypothetical protein PAALTS15_13557 [Paenibacillus alvei TS-15]
MAKVIAPNQQYNGLSATIMFVNGVGETDDPHLLEWFSSKGYQVELPELEVEQELPESEKPEAEQQIKEAGENDSGEEPKPEKPTKKGK